MELEHVGRAAEFFRSARVPECNERAFMLYMPGRSIILTVRPPGSCASPVCCSTVTPGKLATFWRIPVSRLKSVVLPEFGGPTSATVFGAMAGGGKTVAAGQP